MARPVPRQLSLVARLGSHARIGVSTRKRFHGSAARFRIHASGSPGMRCVARREDAA
jgi:hypothetical protein